MREYSREEIENGIDSWIVGYKAERNRLLLKRRLVDGVGFERLAREFGLSVRHTKRIVYECQEKLFRHMA